MPLLYHPSPAELEAAFRRAVDRRCVTAAEAIAHLRRNGWHDLWEAYRASACTNWYSMRDALRGKPGHQKQLRALLALPSRKTTAA